MFSLIQLCIGLSLLAIFGAKASDQCVVILGGDPNTTVGTNYNFAYVDAFCQGPACPGGNHISIAVAVLNRCPEPSDVTINVGTSTLNRDWIFETHTDVGQRTGLMYAYGGETRPCDLTIGNYYNYPVNPCLLCDISYPDNRCDDSEANYAYCRVDPICGAACEVYNEFLSVDAWAYDYCCYPAGTSHHVEAAAFAQELPDRPGAYAEATTWWGSGNLNCYIWVKRGCDGSYDQYWPSCSCPF